MSNADATARQAVVKGYLEAFQDRDVAKCVDFFSNQATIHFLSQGFSGHSAIEVWHRERFNAELQLLNIGQLQETGEGICVDVVATSRVLKSFAMPKIGVRVNFVLRAEKLSEMSFQLRINATIDHTWNPR